MNTYVQQIYNGASMLSDDPNFDRMERHMLLTSLWRIRVAIDEIDRDEDMDEAAEAYMAGYEDESE